LVPLVFLGAAGQVLNIYAQVGLVMLIGLAGGNAILIVDLANQKMGEGSSALGGCSIRCSISSKTDFDDSNLFLNRILALDAGEWCWCAKSVFSRFGCIWRTLGSATFLSTLVVPVFYVVMKTLLGQADAKPASDPQLN
jgi:HAE1 family hydrophobic/amphiphilic exporter-1